MRGGEREEGREGGGVGERERDLVNAVSMARISSHHFSFSVAESVQTFVALGITKLQQKATNQYTHKNKLFLGYCSDVHVHVRAKEKCNYCQQD